MKEKEFDDEPEPTAVAVMTPEQLKDVLTTVGQANAQAMRQSLQTENPAYSETSVFTHPEGERFHPKAKLCRPTFFCGIRQRDDQLTVTEVELFNRFEGEKSTRQGTWRARVHGDDGRLDVSVPAKGLDQLMSLPNGLALILRELLDGEDAVNVERLLARVKELERQTAERRP